MGAYFLRSCHRYLTQREPEWMHYVTGLKLGDIYTLEQAFTFPLTM